jgi:exodeoxyribonuclease-3
MKIATWNVNSVKARMPNVAEWLASAKPDVVLLQEIKCETDAFPVMEFQALGYNAAVLGQKSYNGVAILSLHPIDNVLRDLSEPAGDVQARYIEATVKGLRIASLYLPNGNPLGTEKYDYKLAWMARLQKHAASLLAAEQMVILGGDYNVIPEPEDVFDPKGWENDALYHPPTRAAWRQLLSEGYTEAFRALHPQQQHAYTFWDYQAGSWQRDAGLRIDHFLLSPEAVDRLESCSIDRGPRDRDKASDHTPVILDIRD